MTDLAIADVAAGSQAGNAVTKSTMTGAQVANSGVDLKWLKPDAPLSYTVQPGDTLMQLSGMYLESPGRWPSLWTLNRSDDRNSGPVYPGEILNLHRHNGKAYLIRGEASQQEIRLKPGIRVSEQISSAISSIPYSIIVPFLTKPMMVDSALFAGSATVLAVKDGRLNVGSGGRLYASGIPESATVGDSFALYRPGRTIKDPDSESQNDKSNLLGIEAIFLGEARFMKVGDDGVSTLDVTKATQEIGKGDRLLEISKEKIFKFTPHLPNHDVQGRVVMIHDGRTGTSLLSSSKKARDYDTEGGKLSILVINRGAQNGLEPGHVLDLVRVEKVIEQRSSAGYRDGEKIQAARKLPAEKYGSAMVFKTFEKISYAIVMDATTSVWPGDQIVHADDR